MSRPNLITCLLAAGLLAGCQTCRRTEYTSARAPCCQACGEGPLPPRLAPLPPPAPFPPAGTAPAPGPYAQGEGPRQATFVPPAPLPNPGRPAEGPAPPVPDGETTQPPAQIRPPVPLRRDAGRPPLGDNNEPPAASIPGKQAPNEDRPAPKVEEERDNPLPIELPGFTIARPGVASGLKPFLDGITWLKSHGYKTVLHLRQPGEDNAAARRLFESKGFAYLSLEVSPARLSRELYQQFVKLVDSKANRPLYVYDRDRSAAGGLWYLYFRAHLDYTDARARAEAQRLGLQTDEDASDEHQTMLLAVQKLLPSLKR